MLNSSVTSTISLHLLTYLGKAYPFDLLSFNLTYGLFLSVVLGWKTKGFNPSYMPVWKIVWSSLPLRAWTASPGHSHPTCCFIPGIKGYLAQAANLPPAVPVTSQHRSPNCSYYQPVRKGEGQWFLLTGKGAEKMKETLI